MNRFRVFNFPAMFHIIIKRVRWTVAFRFIAFILSVQCYRIEMKSIYRVLTFVPACRETRFNDIISVEFELRLDVIILYFEIVGSIGRMTHYVLGKNIDVVLHDAWIVMRRNRFDKIRFYVR